MPKKPKLGLSPKKPTRDDRELQQRVTAFVQAAEPGTKPPLELVETDETPASERAPSTVRQRASDGGKDYRATIYVPLRLHEIAKLYCAAERTSMSALVTLLLEEHLAEIGPTEDAGSFAAAYYGAKTS